MRRFVARFKVCYNLISESPAIPYWPYRQSLAATAALDINKLWGVMVIDEKYS